MPDEIKVNIASQKPNTNVMPDSKIDKPSTASVAPGAKPGTTHGTKSRTHRKINKKKLTYFGCAILCVAFIAAIVAVLVISLNKPPIAEDYFVSDDTKAVISLEAGGSSSGRGSSSQTHIVYTYDGDNVTGLKTYFEYSDADAAAAAFESYKNQPEFANAELSDKYIIVTADPSQYEGLTASDVKQQAAAIEQMQSANKQPVESQESEETQAEPEEQAEPEAQE